VRAGGRSEHPGTRKDIEVYMKLIVAMVATIALILPASALAAGGSTCSAYNPQDCNVASTTAAQTTAASTTSTLPFTGLDVVLLAAGGGVLLAGGLVVRRLSRDLN
jgi:hypothetical protein